MRGVKGIDAGSATLSTHTRDACDIHRHRSGFCSVDVAPHTSGQTCKKTTTFVVRVIRANSAGLLINTKQLRCAAEQAHPANLPALSGIHTAAQRLPKLPTM